MTRKGGANLFMYSNGFFSRGFTDRREILHGCLVTSRAGLLPFWRIAQGMAAFWASTGAIWRDMLLAEALVVVVMLQYHQYRFVGSIFISHRRSSVDFIKRFCVCDCLQTGCSSRH